MKVTLMGPSDLGQWYLVDDEGNSYPVVQRHEDHPAAAALFGWSRPEGVTDEEEIIQDALAWLNEHISDEITAPDHVEAFFRELQEDEGAEV